MSVRPTQTQSGYPRRSRQPYPLPEQDPGWDPEGVVPAAAPSPSPGPAGPALVDPPAGDLVSVPGAPEVHSEPVSRVDRRGQRAARRSRRNLAIAVAVLVAVCLVLTILIVNMARNRPSGLDPLPRSVASALGPPIAGVHVYVSAVPVHQTRDAPASEGGNR